MRGKLFQAQPGSWICVQASLYQVLEGRGEGGGVGPVRKALQYLVILLEGDVPHHQVVQQDPQAPHGEAAG